jgi:hypothetical protein
MNRNINKNKSSVKVPLGQVAADKTWSTGKITSALYTQSIIITIHLLTNLIIFYYILVCINTHKYTHIYTHIYIHTYIYTHIYTHI